MYKCKECGALYEIKPDYCECGNDEFEVVNIDTKKKVNNKQAPEKIIPEVNLEQVSKVSSAQSDREFSMYSKLKKISFSLFDIPSLVIFFMCILASIYIIFFAWNSRVNDVQNFDSKILAEKESAKIVKDIPSIDKIWNSAAPVVKSKPVQKDIQTEVVPQVIKQIISKPKSAEQKKSTAVPKATTVPLKKTTTSVQKPQTVSTKSQIQTQTLKGTQQDAVKKNAEQERLAAEAAHLKSLQEAQAKKAAQEKAKQEEAAKQELINYKAQLRNTIGRKIDFTRVIGDGSCTVSFRIDSNGKFINRTFSKQSSNNTLNDAVYNAVMATPTFNPPPSAYNNEVLNLNIRFNNGNFEISLP